MTLVLMISGGRHGRIHDPFLIFTHKSRSYPIRGLPDNTLGCDLPCVIEFPCDLASGVSYRTQGKGWMDKKMFTEWLKEPRAFSGNARHLSHLFLDNCSSHAVDEEGEDVLERKNIVLHHLPKNATDLCQPLDSFVLKVFKDCWKQKWNRKKWDLIGANSSNGNTSSGKEWSGKKLSNPGKRFFLELAAEVAREINARRDESGMSFAQKAMVRCGLGLDASGEWTKSMLFPHLRDIIDAYPAQFDGQLPCVD